MKTALISVFDKTNIIPFAQFLLNNSYKIISSGGTYNQLKQANLDHNENIIEVSQHTLSPEFLDGRVKTLHPHIHGGILAKRDNQNHMDQLSALKIDQIDIVVVNLYPFQQVTSQENVTENDAIENIDIGGHTLIRASAKNFNDVLVLIDPTDYDHVQKH